MEEQADADNVDFDFHNEDVEEEHDGEERPLSFIEILDAPRLLPDPVELTVDHVKVRI